MCCLVDSVLLDFSIFLLINLSLDLLNLVSDLKEDQNFRSLFKVRAGIISLWSKLFCLVFYFSARPVSVYKAWFFSLKP
ncbi:MAG: hypothetical protein EBR67_03800 [Proteobacteria bacterium]|nr:hypothetical protein [Pseudomonadota bacterium]